MAMNMNKLTEKAQEAIVAAQRLAEERHHTQLEPEHLLVALVEQRDGIVPELLRKMNVDPAAVGRGGRDLLKKLPQAYGGSQPGMSPRLTTVTNQAQAEADRQLERIERECVERLVARRLQLALLGRRGSRGVRRLLLRDLA